MPVMLPGSLRVLLTRKMLICVFTGFSSGLPLYLLLNLLPAWLRSEGVREADAVVDFDAAVRDPDQPSRFRPNLHRGDWLHPSDAGYQAMAEAVPLDACD